MVVTILCFLFPTASFAVPANPSTTQLQQPNGSLLDVRIVGDEWNNRIETTDGFTVGKAPDGTWRHVLEYREGVPVLSDTLAEQAPPPGLNRHIHLDTESSANVLRQLPDGSSALPEAAPVGTFSGKVLFILAAFSNRSGTYSEASWGSFVSNNISDYFLKASYGKVSLTPASETSGQSNNGVIGWVNLGYNHPNTNNNTGAANQRITRDAIIAANPFIDYSSYDANSDGFVDSEELAIVIVVAGYERSYSANYTPAVWGHRWGIGSSVGVPNVDGVSVGGFHNGGGYAQFGEIHRRTAGDQHQATMGIMVHELGHLGFGLPDLYDTGGSSSGIGPLGLMGGGSWGRANGDSWAGQTPVLPSAWSKLKLGWVENLEGQGSERLTAAGSPGANPTNAVRKASTPVGTQYFLVENRQPLGYDRGLQRYLGTNFGGIAILHINDSKTNNRNDADRLVDFEEADGSGSPGSSSDLWFLGNATVFGDNTTPNSRLNVTNAPSNVVINNISASNVEMTAHFGATPVNDFNAANGSDLLLVHNTGWVATGMLNNSTLGAFDFLLQVDFSAGWVVTATGDFNGDKKSDVLLYNATTGQYRVIVVDGTNVISDTVVAVLDPSFNLSPFRMGDFDGDGRAEIMVHDPASGYTALLMFTAAGNLSLFDPVTQIDTAGNWTLKDTGDFNGDHKLDLLLYNTVSGESAIIEMNGSTAGPFTSIFTLAPATGWTLKDTGDFTGDGKADILIVNTSRTISVLEMNGAAFVSNYVPGVLQVGWEIVNAGFYNGDDKMDILINNTATGDLLTVIQDGAAITAINTVFSPGTSSGWAAHSGKP